jgi:hypothetical protein
MKKAGSGSVNQRHGSADPDPYQNVTSTTLLLSIQPMSRICKSQAEIIEIITWCLSISLSFSFSSFYLSVSLSSIQSVSAFYVFVLILPTFSLICLSFPVCLLSFNLYFICLCHSPSISLVPVSRLSLSVTRHLSISVPVFHLSSSVSRQSLRLSLVNPQRHSLSHRFLS